MRSCEEEEEEEEEAEGRGGDGGSMGSGEEEEEEEGATIIGGGSLRSAITSLWKGALRIGESDGESTFADNTKGFAFATVTAPTERHDGQSDEKKKKKNLRLSFFLGRLPPRLPMSYKLSRTLSTRFRFPRLSIVFTF